MTRTPHRTLNRCTGIIFSVALLFSGCKQDVILKDAADFSGAASASRDLANQASDQLKKSCEHVLVLDAESRPPTFYALQHPSQLDTGACQPLGEGVEILKDELLVVSTYADLLVRAGSGESVDYKSGQLAKQLATSKLMKSSVDSDLVNTLANGALNLAFRSARAHLVAATVLENNATFQKLAQSIEAVFASDNCSDTNTDHLGRLHYCSLYENEMVQVQTTYCRRAQRVFQAQSSCANVDSAVPTLVVAGPSDASMDQPPSDLDCSVAAIRYRLTKQRLLDAETRETARMPTTPPQVDEIAGAHLSAAEWAARDQLVSQYLTDVALVRSRVGAGFAYAESLCRLAVAHQQLFDFIVKSPDASTALLDR